MRYVHLPGAAVDTALLEDATRRGEQPRLGDLKTIYLTTSTHFRSSAASIKTSITDMRDNISTL